MMRYGWIVVCLLATGCFGKTMQWASGITGVRSSRRIPPPAKAPDSVELIYIFIERDLGNDHLNSKVWQEADEQIVSMELKEKWNNNGLRVGRLGSRLSNDLLALLKDANGRQEGRYNLSKSGQLIKLQLSDVIKNLKLFTFNGGAARGEEISDGQCCLLLTPTIHDASESTIVMTPCIEFGQRKKRNVVRPDLDGFDINFDRESSLFSDLKLEARVGSGEWLLIGCNPDRKGTLGYNSFTKTVGGKTIQSVLLVQIIRPSRDALLTAGYNLDDFFLTPVQNAIETKSRTTVAETVRASRTVAPKQVN